MNKNTEAGQAQIVAAAFMAGILAMVVYVIANTAISEVVNALGSL